jgi:hypothetical protein
MPGAEGRPGFPWNALPWQFNFGLLLAELTPFLILIAIIGLGVLSNRLRLTRPRRRPPLIEDFAGTVQEANETVPYFLIGLWIVVGLIIIGYMINNAVFGEMY